jgi:hypothetical protein
MSDTENQSTQTIDPGHTPGSAEGTENIDDQSKREPDQTSRTPDQAEGESEDAPQ